MVVIASTGTVRQFRNDVGVIWERKALALWTYSGELIFAYRGV